MNIFVTSPCPVESAKYLDDRRLNKMILESAQMLCTALWHYGIQAPYKQTHKNHPCSVWTRTTRGNYKWLLNHLIALCDEFTKRRNKIHKTSTHIKFLSDMDIHIPTGSQQPFVNCTTDYKHISNIHEAYRLQLADKFQKDGKFAYCTVSK